MKKIKSLIARTIKNIGKLTAFAILILPAFAICCLLGSWTIDQNGNVTGENIYNIEQVARENGFYSTINGNTLRWNTNNDYNAYLVYLTNNVYTINAGELGWYGSIYYCDNVGYPSNVTPLLDIDLHYTNTFTITSTTYIVISVGKETATRLMLNVGDEPKQWEPYGKFYSERNYNNMQTEKYNEGYTEGYTNGYNQATEDVINQYAIPIVEGLQIQQVVIHAEDSNNTDLGRISYSIYEDKTNNELELSNINNITGSTKNVIEIYLINNLQLTEFKATEGFYAVILGNQRLSASYDGTNYIIPNESLLSTQVINIIRIEIPTTIRAVNYIMKGSNLSVEGTQNAYETGLNIGKQQQLDEDTATINNLQTQYDTLLDHYNSAQLDNPLSKMVIAVADIPLNLFHNMFNFDIMGFNIAAFILGIITILLVAYVIKLFVK